MYVYIYLSLSRFLSTNCFSPKPASRQSTTTFYTLHFSFVSYSKNKSCAHTPYIVFINDLVELWSAKRNGGPQLKQEKEVSYLKFHCWNTHFCAKYGPSKTVLGNNMKREKSLWPFYDRKIISITDLFPPECTSYLTRSLLHLWHSTVTHIARSFGLVLALSFI